jgi:AcrR family transcriptional regulator
LNEAAKLFRERGFNSSGVADLMKSAGLSHDSFYGALFDLGQVLRRAP